MPVKFNSEEKNEHGVDTSPELAQLSSTGGQVADRNIMAPSTEPLPLETDFLANRLTGHTLPHVHAF